MSLTKHALFNEHSSLTLQLHIQDSLLSHSPLFFYCDLSWNFSILLVQLYLTFKLFLSNNFFESGELKKCLSINFRKILATLFLTLILQMGIKPYDFLFLLLLLFLVFLWFSPQPPPLSTVKWVAKVCFMAWWLHPSRKQTITAQRCPQYALVHAATKVMPFLFSIFIG